MELSLHKAIRALDALDDQAARAAYELNTLIPLWAKGDNGWDRRVEDPVDLLVSVVGPIPLTTIYTAAALRPKRIIAVHTVESANSVTKVRTWAQQYLELDSSAIVPVDVPDRRVEF